MTYVQMTPEEVAVGKFVGKRRQQGADKAKRKQAHGHPDDPALSKFDHVLGALGEEAVAKFLNLFWIQPVFANRGIGDANPGVHVRSTDLAGGRLIIHESDPDDEVFVLAIRDRDDRFLVAGWCYARDGKLADHWRPEIRNPAYLVPQSHLGSAESLKDIVSRMVGDIGWASDQEAAG